MERAVLYGTAGESGAVARNAHLTSTNRRLGHNSIEVKPADDSRDETLCVSLAKASLARHSHHDDRWPADFAPVCRLVHHRLFATADRPLDSRPRV